MDDLVSRRAAIDAVEESRRLNHHQDGKEACAHEYEHRHFLKILMDLPSAESEQKTGKWLKISPAGIYECSECGQAVMTSDIEAYKYCHGCGVKMEVS